MAPVVHATSEVQLVVASACDLGESPSWDGAAQKLLFVDINGKTIYIWDGSSTATVKLDEKVGAVAPTTAASTLVAALEKDVVAINYEDPSEPRFKLLTTTSADHGLPHEGYRFNDAKASPGGVLIAGRMHNSWRQGTPGRVYAYTERDKLKLKEIMEEDKIELPNGMAWDEGKQLMYFADTGANAVLRYQTDSEGVPIKGTSEPAFKLPQDEQHGPPDGITIDSDGNIWVAMAESGRVACFSPTGEELHTVKLPVQRPTALTFGGSDLSILFVTTRLEGGDSPSKDAGGVFSIKIRGVKGAAAAYPFQL